MASTEAPEDMEVERAAVHAMQVYDIGLRESPKKRGHMDHTSQMNTSVYIARQTVPEIQRLGGRRVRIDTLILRIRIPDFAHEEATVHTLSEEP
jgi:hypothetical protein